jgi:hypothetical protein
MEKLSDKAYSILSSLADNLGTTLPHLWEVLIRQVVVEAWVGILSLPLVTLCVLLTFVFVKRWVNSKNAYDDRKFLYAPFAAIATVILGSVASFALTSVMSLVNPEYYALEKITILMQHMARN